MADVLDPSLHGPATREPVLRPLCCPGLDDPSLSEAEAEDIVVMLKALADPVRLRLMNLIGRGGEACACDLPAALDRSQPTVSHHLKVLVAAGLLDREKRGKWAWFSVRTEQLQALGGIFQIVDPVAFGSDPDDPKTD